MNYQQTLEYLFSQLPMFQRIGSAAYKANLDNTLALSKHLGHPERLFKSIHVAGTNGKGSVSHMLASILQEAGYKTGLATSPHLKDFRERIKINGQMIPRRAVIDFVRNNKHFFEQIRPSFFEMTMAMSFEWFAREQVDIAVVETGMGGRLDSSNIISPELSVITNIGLDHVQFLGPGLTDIAREKAGIIKEGIPVVIGQRQAGVQAVFEEVSSQRKAPLFMAGDLFKIKDARHVMTEGQPMMEVELLCHGKTSFRQIGLQGLYQLDNLVTVLAAVDILRRIPAWPVSEASIDRGLRHVVSNTGLLGRWQEIGRRPRVICDAGHNADGIKTIVKQLMDTPHNQLRLVFGMVDDKEKESILSLLPAKGTYYFCRPGVPRGLDAKKLAEAASLWGLKGKVYPSVADALAAAKRDAAGNDLVFVGGSTFVVAEAV